MEHRHQDNKKNQLQPLYLPEELWVIIASNLWVDSLYLRPDARAKVQQQRRRNLKKIYPGALEGGPDALNQLFENPEAVEFFAILPESERHDHRIASNAAYHGNMLLLKRMVKRDANDFNSIACNAAFGGHLGIVQWAVEQGANNFNWIAARAALGGHLEIVQWAIDQGARNFRWIEEWADEGGHLEILQWVRRYQNLY